MDESLLATGPDGLTTHEAQQRLLEFGRNAIEEKAVPKWKLLMGHFWGPMPCMIWAAILIEAIILDWANFWVLLSLQLINGLVGFHEDSKAGDAVAALKASLKPTAMVKRDGRWQNIDGSDVVPGDRVALNAGAAVPADSRVCDGEPVEIDQAALTGESLPVTFYAGQVAKMGSTVTRGESEAIVCATGRNTFFGKTASMIASVQDEAHFQKILLAITRFLLIVSVVLVTIAVAYLLAKKESFLKSLAFGVVLLVASIPIAMQVVCTTTMALGSRKLAEQKAIVARLSSIEQLAGMNVLCSDKTGTLTLNKMVLQDFVPYAAGCTREALLRDAALAAKWLEPPKDALDTLVLKAQELTPLDAWTQLDYTPFDPTRKRTEATLRGPDGRTFTVIKGAPNVVMDLCSEESKAPIQAAFDAKVLELANRGIRSLAVARHDEGDAKGMHMLGLLTFLDPPRSDTKRTIERAVEQGAQVKMITGDHAAIAKETCRQLGMGDNILLPDGLPTFDPTAEIPPTLGDDYGELIESTDGFAQVFPEHKFLIVEALRQKGYSCGMTGDGVNDAPALKKADVGIAVQGATDAARAAADLILTAPGLSVIVDAIILSRSIFQRMKNYVVYRVACTTQLLLFFFITVCFVHPTGYGGWDDDTLDDEAQPPKVFKLPVVVLVLITILNDGTIISIAYDAVKPSKFPEKWRMPQTFAIAFILGGVACVSSLLLLHVMLDSRSDGSVWRGFGLPALSYGQLMCAMYLKISVSDFLTVFSARTRGPFWSRAPGTFLFAAAFVATFLSTVISLAWPKKSDGMEPIGAEVVVAVWAFDVAFFLLQDLSKVLFIKAINSYTGENEDDHKIDDGEEPPESIVAAYRRAKHKIWKTKGNDQTHYQNLSIQDDFADTV